MVSSPGSTLGKYNESERKRPGTATVIRTFQDGSTEEMKFKNRPLSNYQLPQITIIIDSFLQC